MMVFPEHYTTQMLQKICSELKDPGVCTYVGHPEAGGFAYIGITMSENELKTSISASCAVQQTSGTIGLCFARYAELDALVKLYDPTENSASRSEKPWGLDRIDSRKPVLNGEYNVYGSGEGIHVFLFDSGINYELSEFEGRASPLIEINGTKLRVCAKNDQRCAFDGHGHGTHTAGTIGSKTFGVA